MGRGRAAGDDQPQHRRDVVAAHSEKELAAGNYKHGYGFHPLNCYLDETGEALAAILRPGNAGSNTAADHFTVLGLALAQLPAQDLHREILVRTDIGGATHQFTSDCREAGIRSSVGYELNDTVRAAILEVPEGAWVQAIDADGSDRDGAWVAELTDELDLLRGANRVSRRAAEKLRRHTNVGLPAGGMWPQLARLIRKGTPRPWA